MKTKLFYLLMCLFALTATNAQITSVAIVGAGAGGWPTGAVGEVDAKQLTKVGPTSWQITGIILTDGPVKFRSNNSWDSNVAVDGTGAPLAGNWGKPLTGSSFPIGIGAENAGGSKDIIVFAGTYDITFDVATGNYAFNGPPVPVVKLIGTATGGGTGIFMDPTGPNTYGLPANTTLVAGTAQFTVDGVLAGAKGFPSGIVTGIDTDFITVPAGKYTSLSYNFALGEYTFVAAPLFESLAIVGSGAPGGWPSDPQIDANVMTTTNGVIYTIKNLALTAGGEVKFRKNNGWTGDFGGTAFPIGAPSGANLAVNVSGNYDCIVNLTTKEYRFSLSSQPPVSIVGAGAGGWPSDPQMDTNLMATTDGENYTLNNLVLTDGPIKFRQNNNFVDPSWGGTAFPLGTPSGDNLNATAGTWNVTFVRSTGVYAFTAVALALNDFNAKSFSAYPNPTRNIWNIVSGNDDITSVQVFDMLGKSVYAKSASSKEVNVNASTLSKGVYFAKVSTAKGTSTVKLVKE
jgi:hypothetical protein